MRRINEVICIKLKPIDLVTLVIWVIAVAIWVARLVGDSISGRTGTAGVNITLAAVWIASLCVMLYRYWKDRKG